VRQPLGQHFLRDMSVVKTILTAAELKPTDTALEIGPGKAVLTNPLHARVKRLVVVELDRELVEGLPDRIGGPRKPEIVTGDILKVDLDAYFPAPERPIKVLGNLPYSITSPIFETLMVWPAWDTGVFLIQREVAERICADAGSKAFGILSLAVQIFATAEKMLLVKPGAFAPPPRVDSCVIRLRRRPVPLLDPALLPHFFELVKGSFAHRRKTAVNSLFLETGIAKNRIEKWFDTQEMKPDARAEAIPLQDYIRLTAPWGVFRRENAS